MTVIEVIAMAGPTVQKQIAEEIQQLQMTEGKDSARKHRMWWAKQIATWHNIPFSSIKDLDSGPKVERKKKVAMKYKKGSFF